MWVNLPVELWIEISKLLPLKNILRLAQTCRQLYGVSQDPFIYRHKLKQLDLLLTDEGNKAQYINYCKHLSSVERLEAELRFLEKQKINRLGDGSISNSVDCFHLLNKIKREIKHYKDTDHELYLIMADRTLTQLNTWIIQRQLQNAQGTYLKLSRITRLPENIIQDHKGLFSGLERLELKGNCLETLPSNIAFCQRLESLNLYDNPITHLPDEIRGVETLKYFYMSHGYLKRLPEAFFKLNNLEWVALENMQLEVLPAEIRTLKKLSWLYLNGNELKQLPKEISELPNLTELYVEQNRLEMNQSPEIKLYFDRHQKSYRYIMSQQKKDEARFIKEAQDDKHFTPLRNLQRGDESQSDPSALDVERLSQQIKALML